MFLNAFATYGYSKDFTKLEVNNIKNPSLQMQISGKVTDDKNLPVPGVTVLIKGTNKGASTDFDGNYSITAKPGDILVFSYIGMTTVNIIVSTSTAINVKMIEDTSVLDEVVVIGYGSVKRQNLVGAMSTAKEEDLITNPQGDVLSALQGQVSGVQIISSSGSPGAGFEVVIRGASSITGGTTPLYIVDGVQIEADGSNIVSPENDQVMQIGALSFLNPNDIESINVLKDASATAIYGSRGANGVVIITTKKGSFNNKQLSVSYTNTVTMVPENLDLLTMDDYIELRSYRDPTNTRYSTNIGTELDPIYTKRIYPADSIVEINHQKEVLRPTASQQVTLSYNNGNEVSNTAASIGYLKNNGVVKNTDFERITSSLRYSLNLSEKLSFDSRLNTQYSKTNGIRYNGDGGAIKFRNNTIYTKHTSWVYFKSSKCRR